MAVCPSSLSPCPQMIEWAAYATRRTEVEINYLIRLLLFANIKHSMAVSLTENETFADSCVGFSLQCVCGWLPLSQTT